MASKAKKLCFVVGPIGSDDSDTRVDADWLLEMIIRPVMDEFPEFLVRRADEDHRPGLIDAQMINDLLTAELVIADLSGLNPNAFYEIGIRHMVQKPIIHMQRAGEAIPFDVSLYRSIRFSRRKPGDLRDAKAALKAQVAAILAPDYRLENPVTNARGRIDLQMHATSSERVILDRLDAIEARMQTSLPVSKKRRLASNLEGTFFEVTLRSLDRENIVPVGRLLAKHGISPADIVLNQPDELLIQPCPSSVRAAVDELLSMNEVIAVRWSNGPETFHRVK